MATDEGAVVATTAAPADRMAEDMTDVRTSGATTSANTVVVISASRGVTMMTASRASSKIGNGVVVVAGDVTSVTSVEIT